LIYATRGIIGPYKGVNEKGESLDHDILVDVRKNY